MPKRSGNNPTRRIAKLGMLDDKALRILSERIRYIGSGHHKRYPGSYGLEVTQPRKNKTLCDIERPIDLPEALNLIRAGVLRGMVSEVCYAEWPKLVWSVDGNGQPYEARTDQHSAGSYHGYPINEDDQLYEHILREWDARCQEG